MSDTTEQLALQLRALPPEPWGERLRRARDMHGFSQEEAAERLADFVTTSGATISRLEQLDEAPSAPKRRQLAWALCVSYGVDPDVLDLTNEDRPPLVVLRGMFEHPWDDLEDLPDDAPPRMHGLQDPAQLALFAVAA